MNSRFILFLLFIFAASLLFFKLGAAPLFEPDEGRYATISQEMVQSGDWLTPHKNGFFHFHKPPITYQLMAISQKIFGMNEWGVRLPNVLFALGILLVAFGIARKFWDIETAALTSLLLLAIPLFMFIARLATTDIGLCFWTSLGIYAFISYRKGGSRLFLLLSYLALGLAFATKGPVAFVLYLSAVIPFAILNKKEKKNSAWFYHGLGFLIFIVTGFAWYVWAILKYPGLVNYFLFFQTAERVAGDTHHTQSVLYFVPMFLGLFFPLSFFLPAAVRGYFAIPKTDSNRKLALWLGIWGILVFSFFSFVPSKLASYILPVSLPLALGLAGYFREKIRPAVSAGNFFYATCFSVALIMWLLGLGLGVYAKFFLHERLIGFQSLFFSLTVFLPLMGLGIFYCVQTRRALLSLSLILIAMYGALFLMGEGLPKIGSYKNVKPFARMILENRQPGESVIFYRKTFLGLPFYLKERVIEIATKSDISFTPSQGVTGYFYENPDSVKDFILNPKRCFILTKVSDGEELERLFPGKIYKLMSGNKTVLYSNRSEVRT